MKKRITIIFLSLCLLFGLCFASCDNKKPISTYLYYGVVQTLDGYDGLYVQVPNFGVCELPTYEKGRNPNLTLKEGQLISMQFSSEIQVTKSYPAIIATPARSVSVEKNKFALETKENAYLLTLDTTQEIRNQILAYERGMGDTIWFRTIIGVPGTVISPSVQKIGDYCSATIEKLLGERLTLRIPIAVDMQDFFKLYVSGNLKFKGQSIDGTKEPLCNFLDIQTSLEESDIKQIVTSNVQFNTYTNKRIPTEYKTSSNEEDIETVCRWLKYTLVNPIIVEIPYSGVNIEPDCMAELTVYTSRGDFKIQQLSSINFKIWDKYYKVKPGVIEKIPSIKCDAPVYKFDYYTSKTVDFYNWEVFTDKYNFDLSELTFKKTTRPDQSLSFGFFLKTDVGVIELYSAKIFYLVGIGYYEIIGEKDFSVIFDANAETVEKILGNYELIKTIYAEKDHGEHVELGENCYDGECDIVVSSYYGQYESGAIVAAVECFYADNIYTGDSTFPEPVTIAGVEFPYGVAWIDVFYQGEIYGLKSAYENGYLTENDIASVAIRLNIHDYLLSI